MKPQDMLFLAIFLGFLLSKRTQLLVYAGLDCLILAIPLFAKWVFFTAERLTWYAAVFFLSYILIFLLRPDKVQ